MEMVHTKSVFVGVNGVRQHNFCDGGTFKVFEALIFIWKAWTGVCPVVASCSITSQYLEQTAQHNHPLTQTNIATVMCMPSSSMWRTPRQWNGAIAFFCHYCISINKYIFFFHFKELGSSFARKQMPVQDVSGCSHLFCVGIVYHYVASWVCKQLVFCVVVKSDTEMWRHPLAFIPGLR